MESKKVYVNVNDEKMVEKIRKECLEKYDRGEGISNIIRWLDSKYDFGDKKIGKISRILDIKYNWVYNVLKGNGKKGRGILF